MRFKVFLLAVLWALPYAAHAVHIMWSWKPPTQREDGTVLTPAEIHSYEVRYRVVGAPTYTWLSTAEPHIDLEVPMGRHQVDVYACDTKGLCSNFITKVFDVTGHPTKGISYPRVKVVPPPKPVKPVVKVVETAPGLKGSTSAVL